MQVEIADLGHIENTERAELHAAYLGHRNKQSPRFGFAGGFAANCSVEAKVSYARGTVFLVREIMAPTVGAARRAIRIDDASHRSLIDPHFGKSHSQKTTCIFLQYQRADLFAKTRFIESIEPFFRRDHGPIRPKQHLLFQQCIDVRLMGCDR